jgi:hypothetical protein
LERPCVGTLQKPLNSVPIARAALKTVGFEVLKPAQNTTDVGMMIAINALLCSAPPFAFLPFCLSAFLPFCLSDFLTF